jgi:uncharacterized membrane protein YqjE
VSNSKAALLAVMVFVFLAIVTWPGRRDDTIRARLPRLLVISAAIAAAQCGWTVAASVLGVVAGLVP